MKKNQIAENVRSTISAIGKNPMSKGELAEYHHIGMQTAEKILRVLEKSGILRKIMVTPRNPGRPAQKYALSVQPFAAVVFITGTSVRTYLYSAAKRPAASVFTEITEPLFPDDALISHFRSIAEFAPKLKEICILADGAARGVSFIGTGISGLDGFPVSDVASEFCTYADVILESRYIAEYRSVVPCADSETALFLKDENGRLGSAVIFSGSIVAGKSDNCSAARELLTSSGRKASSALGEAGNIWEYASCMADLAAPLLRLLRPDNFIVCTDRFDPKCGLISIIEERLMLEHGFDAAELPVLIPLEANGKTPPDSVFEELLERSIDRCTETLETP